MTDGISSRTCYTKLNFDFPYVRFLSLRRDPYLKNFNVTINPKGMVVLPYGNIFRYDSMFVITSVRVECMRIANITQLYCVDYLKKYT